MNVDGYLMLEVVRVILVLVAEGEVRGPLVEAGRRPAAVPVSTDDVSRVHARAKHVLLSSLYSTATYTSLASEYRADAVARKKRSQ